MSLHVGPDGLGRTWIQQVPIRTAIASAESPTKITPEPAAKGLLAAGLAGPGCCTGVTAVRRGPQRPREEDVTWRAP